MYNEKQENGKMQSHIDLADIMATELATLNHEEQLEAFCHLRKTLINSRNIQFECMQKELELMQIKINTQAEGTKIMISQI